jgi:hypothetical protein
MNTKSEWRVTTDPLNGIRYLPRPGIISSSNSHISYEPQKMMKAVMYEGKLRNFKNAASLYSSEHSPPQHEE